MDVSLQISKATRDRVSPALELLFRSLPRDERAAQMATTLSALRGGQLTTGGLFEAVRAGRLVGVVWASPCGGKTALIWPPVVVAGEGMATTTELLATAQDWMLHQGMNLANAFLHDDHGTQADHLIAGGYRCAAEILYLVSQRRDVPEYPPAAELEFLPSCEFDTRRLGRVVEATYQGTLDCPQLNGRQETADVLAGYREAGVFRPELWMIVRHGNEDIGCLLLADHAAEGQYELIYQGVTPAARGNGFGMQITRHAQWLAGQAGRERLVLAVDANNHPALNIYREAGFRQWERRFLFLKFLVDETKAAPATRAA